MKKTLLFYILLATLLFSGCKKDDKKTEQKYCEENNISYVSVSNNSDNPYKVYINGTYEFTVPGNTLVKDYELKANKSYQIHVKQKSGYLIYPTEQDFSFYADQCDLEYIAFPN